jgi:hypothetical protein
MRVVEPTADRCTALPLCRSVGGGDDHGHDPDKTMPTMPAAP